MQKKGMLALMLAGVLALSGCALVEKDEAVDNATEIIRIGDTVHTKGEIKSLVDNQLTYLSYVYSRYGMKFDATSEKAIADAREQVVKSLVDHDVELMKAAELGISLTAEQEEKLKTDVDTNWNKTLTNIQNSYFAKTELTGDALTEAVAAKAAEQGYSKERIEKNLREQELVNALTDAVKAEVTEQDITTEELQTKLSSLAASAQQQYTTNTSAFGMAVNGGQTVYYRPAGYRMVKHLLVKLTDADTAVINDLTAKRNAATSRISSLEGAIKEMGVEDPDALASQVTVAMQTEATAADPATATDLATATDMAVNPMDAVLSIATVSDLAANFTTDVAENVAEQVKQLAQAKAEEAFYQEQLTKAQGIAYANISGAADEIAAQLAAGADFDALMAEKTEDPGMQGDAATAKTGYAVTDNMSNMDPAFIAAAMALEKVGDVSPKTSGMYGYSFIKYESDVTEGEVSLDEVKDTLLATVLNEKRDSHYKDSLAAWVEAAGAKIDMKSLEN